jgi:hypothetical protein
MAAPANAAALKPGAPTAVKAAPTATGTAVVTWKAPVVKKGKTAKATSYTVVCGTGKVTTKATHATVTVLKVGAKDGVTCKVTPLAGKLAGKAASSSAFTAYKQMATATFTLTGAAATSLGSKLGAKAPAVFNASTLTITLPVVSVTTTTTANDTLGMAGALIVAGVPVPQITVAPEPAPAMGVSDLSGKTSIGVIPVLTLSNFKTDATTGVVSFDITLTSNPQVVQLLTALGITATAGEALGTGTVG